MIELWECAGTRLLVSPNSMRPGADAGIGIGARAPSSSRIHGTGGSSNLGWDWFRRESLEWPKGANISEFASARIIRHRLREMSVGSTGGYRYLRVDMDNLRQELYVTSVGCVESAAGQPYPAPGHPEGYRFDWSRGRVLGDFAIVLISRGAGTFETRSHKLPCRSGDALLIAPGVWHRYRPDVATGWREHWVCVNGDFLHRLRSKQRFVRETTVCQGAANITVLAAHRRLWDRLRGVDSPNDLALAAEALEIFGLALQSHQGLAQRRAPTAETGDLVADAAREFIWFNSHRPLAVSLIARHLGVSRRTLERRYARSNGVTVVHEVIARRVERACQLLAETHMSVKEISYAVGFGDSRRLIRNFTRSVGVTPVAFREGHLRSEHRR
jgi:AraC-like DNA-binding protein